MDDVYRLFNMP